MTQESLDAARYRRLREDGHFAVMIPRETGHIAFSGEGLDAKIDWVMKAQPPTLGLCAQGPAPNRIA